MPAQKKISAEMVRADFNEITAVVYYTRAAHELGLWESERLLIEHFFPDRGVRLLEAGCGAGRVALGLWQLGFLQVTGFDFAEELLDQARSLAALRGADGLRFVCADATDLTPQVAEICPPYGGALFMFNGLMQIPGREQRRAALRELHRVCGRGAPLLFTTHDREESAVDRADWRREEQRWQSGTQDPRLLDFGDRYFENESGRTFMHLPVRTEILEDLCSTGWEHTFDEMRSRIARESLPVRDFSDECRFWAARRV